MRIDPNVSVSPITQEPHSASPKAAERRPGDEAAAIVALSRPAVATTPSEETSPAMAARLDKIRALLDAGEYPIDLDQLTTHIVDDEWLRGGSR